MKKENKQKLLNSFNKELRTLYHKAEANHPYNNIPDNLEQYYCEHWFNITANHAVDDLQSKYKNLGKIYKYGRGGASLIPEKFANKDATKYVNQYDIDDFSVSELTQYIIDLQAFSQEVIEWNKRSNIKELWTCELQYFIDSNKSEIIEIKQAVKSIIKELRNINLSNKLCEVVKKELTRLRVFYKKLLKENREYKKCMTA
jgi:hypothetical protein